MSRKPDLRIAVIVSRYNGTVTDRLLEGARAAYAEQGLPADGLEIFYAPGAFELPAVASAAIGSCAFAGVVALGCIIKGETSHDRVLADAVTQALCELSRRVPVGLGVLTVETPEQALARSGGADNMGTNKGAEAMSAVLATISECRRAAGFAARPDDHGYPLVYEERPQAARPDKLIRAGTKGQPAANPDSASRVESLR